MERSDAEEALLELSRQLVGELAGGKLMELMLATAGASPHSDAGRALAGARWAKPPGEVIGGRPVLQVFSHPQSPVILYDLGGGYFAEGERGKAPGTVMHSPQFKPQDLAAKGWQVEALASGSSGAEPGGQDSGSGGSAGASTTASSAASEPVARRPTRLSPADRSHAARQSGDAVLKALMSGTATDEQGTLDGHGQVWHPDRASAHKEIVQQHLDDATPVPSEGRAILTGGLSHKHTEHLAKAGAWDDSRYHTVSVPGIAGELAKHGLVPEVKGVHDQHAQVLAHREASHVASMVTSALAARRKNMVIHGSMADPEHARVLAGRLRSSGYSEVRGAHLSTPPDQALREAGSAGIPPSAVAHSLLSHGGDKTRQGFEAAKEHLDGWERWDHSGGTPVRKERGGKPSFPAGAIRSVEDLMKHG